MSNNLNRQKMCLTAQKQSLLEIKSEHCDSQISTQALNIPQSSIIKKWKECQTTMILPRGGSTKIQRTAIQGSNMRPRVSVKALQRNLQLRQKCVLHTIYSTNLCFFKRRKPLFKKKKKDRSGTHVETCGKMFWGCTESQIHLPGLGRKRYLWQKTNILRTPFPQRSTVTVAPWCRDDFFMRSWFYRSESRTRLRK